MNISDDLLNFFFFNIYLFGGIHAITSILGMEDNLWESILTLHHMGSGM